MREPGKQYNLYAMAELADAQRRNRPLEDLQVAVLGQAFMDYATAFRIVYCDAHERETKRTRQTVAHYKRLYFRPRKLPAWVRNAEDYYLMLYRRRVRLARTELEDIRRWCNSPAFDIWSNSINGDWLIKAAETAVLEYLHGERKTYKPVLFPAGRNDLAEDDTL